MPSPLVLRPPYGTSLAESGLPAGPPAQRGVSLDPGVPGSKTFSKPSDEPAREQGKDDESIHRVDGPDDLTKGPQTVPDERDHTKFKPTQAPPGDSEGVTPKTKYPYRDGFPSRNASADFVAELWKLREASEEFITPGVRTATRMSEIEQGLNPKVVERGRRCSVALKRADLKNLRWLFSVDSGNGPKLVRLRASRKGNTVQLGKMDLFMSCSCPAWRWWGAEHNSKANQYLDGKPVGTAAAPDIRDPDRKNKVCKHAQAVLQSVKDWILPLKK